MKEFFLKTITVILNKIRICVVTANTRSLKRKYRSMNVGKFSCHRIAQITIDVRGTLLKYVALAIFLPIEVNNVLTSE